MSAHTLHTTGAGPAPAKQNFGMYLGTVAHTRTQDPWVQVNIPQLLGMQESNWARPIGFTSIGKNRPPPVGSLVLVWFVAGDVTRPAYALTSQSVG